MITIRELTAARQLEKPRADRSRKKDPKPLPAASATSPSAKQIIKTGKLGDLLVKKEMLTGQLVTTLAAEKRLKEEASRLQQEALAEENRNRLSRRRFINSVGAASATAMTPAHRLETPDAALATLRLIDQPIVDGGHSLYAVAYSLVKKELAHVEFQVQILRNVLTTVSWAVKVILGYYGAQDLIRQIVLIQIPWFLVHGCHPPATQKPATTLGFFPPGPLRQTV